MFKWIIKLGNWLSEHAPVWPWEKGYQSTTNLIWTWITFIGMILIGVFCNDVTLGFAIIIGGGQVFALIQEFIRWIFSNKTDSDSSFNVGNIFANIIGIVVGGLFACLIWLLLMM